MFSGVSSNSRRSMVSVSRPYLPPKASRRRRASGTSARRSCSNLARTASRVSGWYMTWPLTLKMASYFFRKSWQ